MATGEDTRPVRLDFEFANSDRALLRDVIGATLDLALTRHGASLGYLETVDLALAEVVEALTEGSSVQEVFAEIDERAVTVSFVVAEPVPQLDPDARSIVDSAFSALRCDGTTLSIEASFQGAPP